MRSIEKELDNNGLDKGARALGHEIAAHVDGDHNLTQQQQHDAYGQTVMTEDIEKTNNGTLKYLDPGTGKAKILNTQVDKAVNFPNKNPISTTKAETKGGSSTIYKVDVKK